MHEGRTLLERWARALETTPLPSLVERLENGEHVQSLEGPSGAAYKLTIESFWEHPEAPQESDFYVLLKLHPPRRLNPFCHWRANLVATYDRERKHMNKVVWIQRDWRERHPKTGGIRSFRMTRG